MDHILLDGLRELSKSAFPRKCENCGRVYNSFDHFVHETNQLEGRSGLKENLGCPEEGDEPIVELYRNCVCGSTLMEFLNDRRDTSEMGRHRRETFGKLIDVLIERGISREDARNELLAILHNKTSVMLENMGIETKLK